MSHRRVVFALSTLCLASVVVACSKDPSAAAGAAPSAAAPAAVVTSTPGARQELPACSIVSIQDVETTLGVTGLKGPDTAGEWPVRACQFNGGSLNLPLVTVRFEVTRDLADFGKIRKF